MLRLTKIAKLAVKALEDIKGVDIKVLDVKPLTPITDFMIICTGTSNRHVKSLANSVIESAKHAGHQPSGVEGMEMGEWVLVNLGEVIVHIMQLQSRAFYQLEKLWELQVEAPPAAPKKPKAKAAKSKPKAAKARPKSVAKSTKRAVKPAAKKATAAKKTGRGKA